MIPGTDNFIFPQSTLHGGAPIAQFYALTKVCTFHGDCQIPNMYNKTYVDILTADFLIILIQKLQSIQHLVVRQTQVIYIMAFIAKLK